jgi:hypothetical protein
VDISYKVDYKFEGVELFGRRKGFVCCSCGLVARYQTLASQPVGEYNSHNLQWH